jgi:hypothetical protein
MMDNPYHHALIKPHYLDRHVARVKCFDAFNIVSASVALAGEYEMAEPDEPAEFSTMFRLHHRLAESRLSQLLLEIAVFVRTFDDQMTAAAPEEYGEFCAQTGGEDFIGVLDGSGDFNLREACNKIIHATDFRPVYEWAERDFGDDRTEKVWHLDGQIEIKGMHGNKEWEAVLFIEQFLEIVLDRLDFELPTLADGAENAPPGEPGGLG